MSTTRWIIETACAVGDFDCEYAKRIVVDPDNIPPEAIQRVAVALEGKEFSDPPPQWQLDRAELAIRAFLSDPKQVSQ